MKVLVTGATGFLGEYIVKELSEKGYKVIAFGRNEEKGRDLSRRYIHTSFIKGNFENIDDLKNIDENIDYIVHAGGLSTVWGKWKDFYNSNVKGTENIIRFCKESDIKKLVFISSPSIYAKPKDGFLIKEEEAPSENRLNFYIRSKILAESRIKEISNMPWVIIRPRGLFGVGDTSIIPRLLRLNSKIGIPLFSDGSQMIDITCVENVALSIRLALEKKESVGNIYNITNDEPMQFKEILELFFDEMGIKGRYIRLNYSVIKFIVNLIEKLYSFFKIGGEPPLTLYTLYLLKYSQTLSVEKAKKDLGYKPEITIREGIRNYVRYNRED